MQQIIVLSIVRHRDMLGYTINVLRRGDDHTAAQESICSRTYRDGCMTLNEVNTYELAHAVDELVHRALTERPLF